MIKLLMYTSLYAAFSLSPAFAQIGKKDRAYQRVDPAGIFADTVKQDGDIHIRKIRFDAVRGHDLGQLGEIERDKILQLQARFPKLHIPACNFSAGVKVGGREYYLPFEKSKQLFEIVRRIEEGRTVQIEALLITATFDRYDRQRLIIVQSIR